METKVNSGAIFRNDKKTKETQPDYRGRVNVEGKELEISLWLKESKAGLKYFSAAFSEPYNKVVSEAQPVTGNESKINDINSLPF